MSGLPSAVKLEPVACPLCGSSLATHVLTSRDLLHDLPGIFSVVQCSVCSLKRTNPRPTAETIGYYYPSEYGAYVDPTTVAIPGQTRNFASRLYQNLKRFLNVRSHSIPSVAPGHLLEVGCATGVYLKEMALAGWSVEGIEFSADAAETAKSLGFPVETGALETIDRPSNAYDMITAWMVIEHLHEPLLVLTKMRQWIKPTGRLVLSVPNTGSMDFRLFKSNWYALQLPTHLFHYDQKSLTRLLDRSGWKVVKVLHQRTLANYIGSMGYWLRSKGFVGLGEKLITFPERGGRIGALVMFPFAFFAAAFGQTGRMTVWAEPSN